jgi:hypothetical protein
MVEQSLKMSNLIAGSLPAPMNLRADFLNGQHGYVYPVTQVVFLYSHYEVVTELKNINYQNNHYQSINYKALHQLSEVTLTDGYKGCISMQRSAQGIAE